MFPSNGASTAVHEDHKLELGPHFINQTIRFRDPKTGKVVECKVQDCGTSHIKGDWFEVVYDDMKNSQVMARELKEMLANRVE